MLWSPTKSRDDARVVLDVLRRMVRALRLYARLCERRLGLSAAQLFALRALAAGGPMGLGDLARATLTDPSSVSVVAGRLQRKGLIQRRRDDDDHRRIKLALSPAGRRALRGVPESPQERLARALRALPPGRLKALAKDWNAVLKATGMQDSPVRLFFEDET